MAANDYYGGPPPNQPYQPYEPYQPFQSYGDSRPSPGPPPSPGSPRPGGAGFPPGYDHRNSQQSVASYDQDYPAAGAGGRMHGSTDQYADDIPLKSNAPTATGDHPGWMDADTNYPPQDEPLNDRSHSRRKKKKKRANRFFKKKIPWVVYLTSLVAVIVFIVELVKNGTSAASNIVFFLFLVLSRGWVTVQGMGVIDTDSS